MEYADLPEATQDLVGFLFNPEIPTSLAAVLPKKLSGHLLREITKDFDMLPLLTREEDLREYIMTKYSYKTPVTDERMRMTFWMEYERAQRKNEKMIVYNIHSLVCDERVFYRVFCTNPGRAAFLVCRPVAYQEQVKSILASGLRFYQKVLDMPDCDAKGKPDHKLLALKTKIVTLMDLRLHGAPTQKVQQLNVNVEADKGQTDRVIDQIAQSGDLHAVQQRLSEIAKLEAKAQEVKAEPLSVRVERVLKDG